MDSAIVVATIIYAIATVVLVGVTWKNVSITQKHVETTTEMLKEMRKERRVAYLEKQLEKLYFPLERHKEYLCGEPSEIVSSYEFKLKEYSEFISNIYQYSYLARPMLKKSLQAFLLDVESGVFTEKQGDEYSEAILKSLEIDVIEAELEKLVQ